MSPRQPRVTARDVLRALKQAGWLEARQKGPHVILRQPADPSARVSIPVHSGETLKKGTLAAILKQARLTVDEFIELL